jgi:gamma-D-glutamyl-L-lysine dipeptidyl-peptidase
MDYGICLLSVIPLRAESSDKSEIVTQILFGEMMEVTGRQEQWRKVRTNYDNYDGWLDVKQIAPLTTEDFFVLSKANTPVTMDVVQIMVYNRNQMIPVVLGSSLPAFDGKKISISGTEYFFEGNVRNGKVTDKKFIVENAYMYMNAPYLWGGRSPFGIDCSGFTQMVYKLCGIKIRRDAAQQAEEGSTVHLLEEAEPGDLAFFDNPEGRIVHCGIILPGDRIIHASGRVRIDQLDHHGIFNPDTKKYSHHLRLVKRIF